MKQLPFFFKIEINILHKLIEASLTNEVSLNILQNLT